MPEYKNKTAKSLKREIFEKVKKYYALAFPSLGFTPLKSKIGYAGRVFDEKELINLVDSGLEFWLTAGRFADKFEKDFAKFIGVNNCILVNSGSSANLLAISALTSPSLGRKRLKPGDEIITTACGFPTTIAPIIQNRLIPVFVDVELGTYNVDCSSLKKAVTKKTKAVILAHTLGNPFEIDKIKDFCQEYDLWFIEDNCDALGSRYKGRFTGSFGHLATQSFYPAHHLTMGEGGAILTSDNFLKKLVCSFRDWGRHCWCLPGKDNTCGRRFSQRFGRLPLGYDHKYVYSHLGYNLRITDMQAAIGCAQLKKLTYFIKKRKQNFSLFYEGLKPYKDKFILPQTTKYSEPSWFGFLLTVKNGAGFNRKEIVEYLETRGIQTRMLFAGNIIRHPCFGQLRAANDYRVVGDLRNTDIIMNQSFWIGVYPAITEETVAFILDTIERFIKSH